MNIETKSYPDNTIYVDLGFPWTESNIPIDLFKPNVFRINNYEDIFRLEALSDALTGVGGYYDILIPNLLHSQDDRRWAKGQSYGLSIVLKRLIALENFNYHFFHVHNESVVEMAFNIVGQQHRLNFIDNSEFLSSVMDSLYLGAGQVNDSHKNFVILSPDAGSYKWINKAMDNLGWQGEVLSASKYRLPGGKGRLKQQLPIQDFEGKDILICDDISIYGGTFKGLSTLLDKANVGKKYLAVSHMTVQDLGEDPVTNYFNKVFTTNSKYNEYTCYRKSTLDNLEIIELFD